MGQHRRQPGSRLRDCLEFEPTTADGTDLVLQTDQHPRAGPAGHRSAHGQHFDDEGSCAPRMPLPGGFAQRIG
jgi:hypothetical protein